MQKYQIILTNEELHNLNSLKGTKKLGYYGECIMLHIIEQLEGTKQVRHITNKKQQIELENDFNDLEISVRKFYHRINMVEFLEICDNLDKQEVGNEEEKI